MALNYGISKWKILIKFGPNSKSMIYGSVKFYGIDRLVVDRIELVWEVAVWAVLCCPIFKFSE